MKKVYKIRPNFPEMLAHHGYSLRGFCKEFDVPHNTIYSALNPEDYPDRVGGIHARTAWRVARAYAQATGQSEEEAYNAVIVEEIIE